MEMDSKKKALAANVQEAVTKLNEELRLAQEAGLKVLTFPPLMGGVAHQAGSDKGWIEVRIRLYDQTDYL